MMQTKRWKRRAAAFLAGATLLAGVASVSTPSSPVSAQATVGAGGEFFPLTPYRLLDTRNRAEDTAPFGAKRTDPNGEIFSLQVANRGGVPENNVLAVAISVVAISPDGRGSITARPSGSVATSATSLVNFNSTTTAVANLGIVGVGSNGQIDIQLTTPQLTGDMHVVVDLYGWIATSGYNDAADEGARVRTVTPKRFMDTRFAADLPPAMSSPRRINPNESIRLPIRGVAPVPNSANVTGVIVNLSGIEPTSQSRLSLTPERPTEPLETANGNFVAGEVRGSFAIAPIGDDGSIWITAGPGALHATVDVLGYLEAGASDATNAGRVVPLSTPFRSLDTREPEFGSVPLGPERWEDWSFARFAESVELGGATDIPQQGFFGNLSGFDLARADRTFLTFNPREPQPFTTEPENASMNHAPAQVVTNNMMLVRYGNNGEGDDAVVSTFNRQGSVHYTLDVFAVVLDD